MIKQPLVSVKGRVCMSRESCYALLSKAIGDNVKLETTDGAIYQGVVVQLDVNYLYLFAMNEKTKQLSLSQITEDDLAVIPLASIVMLDFISLYW